MKTLIAIVLTVFISIFAFFAYDPNPNFSVKNISSNTTAVIPKGYYLMDIIYESTNANAVTGGIRIGTTNGGADVVLAQSLSGNSFVNGQAGLLKQLFSNTSDQTLFIQAGTSWNSANVNIYFLLSKLQ